MRCSRFNFRRRALALPCRLRGALALDSVQYYQLCKTIRGPGYSHRRGHAFWTLPPAKKVHKINEITPWLLDRRSAKRADGEKFFRESSIQTTSSQSPERGTGLRRTCSVTDLGGEWEHQGFFASRLARRVVAQPSMLACLARLTARASAGTSL